MIEYRTLENATDIELHAVFSEAFADYFVSFEMSVEQFMTRMLRRKSYNPEISVGAFSNGQLVGFVFNGLRTLNGKLTAYDCGTAMIPEYRSKGIGTKILKLTNEILLKKNVNQYLLEVIQENEPAVNLYLKEGFVVTREFNCYKSEASTDSFVVDPHIQIIKADEFVITEEFFDFNPSWQNSVESILEIPSEFSCSVYKSDNEIIGFGMIEKSSGDIPLLAVAPEHRMKGIGTKLWQSLLTENQSSIVKAINIDSASTSANEFLKSNGLAMTVKQFEMIKTL